MLFIFLLLIFANKPFAEPPAPGIHCRFKQQRLSLTSGMRIGKKAFRQRGGLADASLDTLSNWYSARRRYVEIVRQDAPQEPRYGVALGFEFDEINATYPYVPAFAKIQIKDFRWGGVEFSAVDTFNYTGLTNTVSDDLSVEVDSFRNDTIFGRFSGLLLSGAGPMAAVDSGYFRVFVYRVH